MPQRTPKPSELQNQGSLFFNPSAAEFGVVEEVEGGYYPREQAINNYSKPEKIHVRHAYDALDRYALQCRSLGFAMYLYNKAQQLAESDDYDESEAQRLIATHYTATDKAKMYGMEAKSLFAKAISIPCTVRTYQDEGMDQTAVFSIDPNRQQELDKRYREFAKQYAGVANAKRRDRVRKRKEEIVVPGYSAVDRRFDAFFAAQNTAQKTPSKPLEVVFFPDTILNDPGEPVYAVDIAESTQHVYDTLLAFGVRNQKLRPFMASFRQRLMAGVDTQSANTGLPARRAHESTGDYFRRLTPDQLVVAAKQAFWQATGFTALRGSNLIDDEQLNSEALAMWKEFWSAYSSSAADASIARLDYKMVLEQNIKRYRRILARRTGQLTLGATVLED